VFGATPSPGSVSVRGHVMGELGGTPRNGEADRE
jgi:hypothetical protein